MTCISRTYRREAYGYLLLKLTHDFVGTAKPYQLESHVACFMRGFGPICCLSRSIAMPVVWYIQLYNIIQLTSQLHGRYLLSVLEEAPLCI